MRDMFDTTLQSEKWSCGPAAIVNAVTALGLIVDEQDLMSFATPENGMDDPRMVAALQSLGLVPTEYISRQLETAWKTLTSNLPAVVCVDLDQHWVAVTRLLTDGTIEVRDPAIGTRAYDMEQFAERWQTSGRYAMILMGK